MSKNPTEKDFSHLGRAVSKVLVRDNIQIADNWRRFIWVSFVRGIFVGVGGVIGATIVIGIIIWILGGFQDVPGVKNIKETLEKSR